MKRRQLPMLDGEALHRATVEAQGALDAGLSKLLTKLRGHGTVIPCRQGCPSCCFYAIDIELLDVWNLIAELRTWSPADRAAVRERLSAALRRAQGARIDLTSLHERKERRLRYLAARIACPFLVDDACSIYRVRPSVCRTHYVANTDPADCRNPRAAFDFLRTQPYVDAFFEHVAAGFVLFAGEPLPRAALATTNLLLALDGAWSLIDGPEPTLEAWLGTPIARAALRSLVARFRRCAVGSGGAAGG